MAQALLKTLRFLIPGVVILIYTALLGLITEEWPPHWPNLKEMKSDIAGIILAGVYYALPLRKWSNKFFHRKVSENIRSRLVKVSGLTDDPATFSWKALRGIFYPLLDNDKSLSIKVGLAYFNGLIWTTVADVRAIGVVFTFLALLLAVVGADNALVAAGLFISVAILSLPISYLLTESQKKISNQQIEIIEHNKRSQLIEKLMAVRDRPH